MFNFGSGEDLVEGGKEAGKKASEDYEEHRYHAPGDEYEAIANWDGMLADLQLYYAAGRMLAMTDAWPNWVEGDEFRSEEHTSELQSLMRISYAVFCLKKKNKQKYTRQHSQATLQKHKNMD